MGVTREKAIGAKCYELTHHQPKLCRAPADTCPIFEIGETPGIEVHNHKSYNGDSSEVIICADIFRYIDRKYYVHLSTGLDKTISFEESKKLIESEMMRILSIMRAEID